MNSVTYYFKGYVNLLQHPQLKTPIVVYFLYIFLYYIILKTSTFFKFKGCDFFNELWYLRWAATIMKGFIFYDKTQ